MKKLRVRSNVRRDLLQSAQLFKNEKLVIWEYVANSLQYVESNTVPVVEVTVDSRAKRICIQDNGRGMDFAGLQNFFVMHGENEDRLRGKGGRGRFGTGKSAVFGIAHSMKVTSVRDGKRSSVLLTRQAIDSAGDNEIPLEVDELELPVDEPNGTLIEIDGIQLRRLDQVSVVRYVERHLSRWPGRPRVIINSHECEPNEPPVSMKKACLPDLATAAVIGTATLTLKVSSIPLDTDQQGVAVFASGVWLTSTLAGIDGQPMANFIFGEIDVPALDNELDPIPAFDMTRSMVLNPENSVVQALMPFLGREIDLLRRELVKADKERRAEEESRRLQDEADTIASIINDDFLEFSDKLQRLTSKRGRGKDRKSTLESSEINEFLITSDSGELKGDVIEETAGGTGGGESSGAERSDGQSLLKPQENGIHTGNPVSSSSQRRRRGGFRVEFKPLSENEARARYVRDERVIYVNLDHPQLKAAAAHDGLHTVPFRRVAYEVAFCEYAIALASEFAASQEYMDPTDPIIEIRETMNRMAVKSVRLYEM